MSKITQLINLLKKEKHIYIQTHNFPDPDAVASAFGLQFIFKKYKIKSKIIYSGFIIDKIMYDMIKSLKIKAYHSHSVQINKNSKIILVDTQISHDNVRKLKGTYIACIDHHEISDNIKNIFYDLQPDIGACSTIKPQHFLYASILTRSDSPLKERKLILK